jgi:two-component system, NarL family, invasion response regulator UvrY
MASCMSRARVYIVDDHPLMRDGLQAALTQGGCVVVGASGDLTVASAEIRATQVDLVLLDLNLGKRSGLDLLADLAQRGVSVRTLVLTMSAQPRHVAEAFKAGAQGYVLKGAGAQELLHAVSEVLAGRHHVAAELAPWADPAAARTQAPGELDALSARERQVLLMVVRGHSSQAIAKELHLSAKTVDTYRSRLMSKLGVADIPALVRLAIRTGMIDPNEA